MLFILAVFLPKFFICVLGCFFDFGLAASAGCVLIRPEKAQIVPKSFEKSMEINEFKSRKAQIFAFN
jgi:hypothetical protein